MYDRALFQSLESRILMSTVTLTDGELVVVGEKSLANTIVVSMSAGGTVTNPDGSTTTTAAALSVQVNTDPPQTFDPALVSEIKIQGGDLADWIAVDETNGPLAIKAKVFAGKGDDSIQMGSEDDQIFGGDGNDSIWTGNGSNMVHGQKGNDTVVGGMGSDKLFGDQGDDSLTGGSGADKIQLGKNDVLTDAADGYHLTGPGAHLFKSHGKSHGHGHDA